MTDEERTAALEKAIQKAIDEKWIVNRDGTIYSHKIGRNLKQVCDRKGYLTVSVYDEDGKSHTTKVHRIVALAHIPNPDNLPHINHKNGVRDDNRVDNLEWCTPIYNVQDGWKRGRVTWNKGNVRIYHRICTGCGLRKEFTKKRQITCSRRCAALVRHRRVYNDRARDKTTGRFLPAAA